MNKIRSLLTRDLVFGQSLVEVALFLPILVFMLAGLAEVGNLLITQNKVTTASRMSAGFGAANYDKDNFTAGTALDMGIVAINTVTDTMDLSPDKWDVWSIRAKTDSPSSLSDLSFEFFEAVHAYGNNVVVSEVEWNDVLEQQVRDKMLADLKSWPNGARGLEVVASAPFNKVETILGLPIWQWTGFKELRAITVMRVNELKNMTGCPVLPITIRLNQFSIYPWNWDRGPVGNLNKLGEKHPDDPVDLFPIGSGPFGWEYPQNPEPVYKDLEVININSVTTVPDENYGYPYQLNIPGISLKTAIAGIDEFAGNIYWAREQGISGNFGWLRWNSKGANALKTSLTYPGDFVTEYPDSGADENTTGDPLPVGMKSGDGDDVLERFEWLQNETGNVAATQGIIEGYVKSGLPVVIIVYSNTNADLLSDGQKATGDNALFQVYDFIKVRLLGYSFQGGKGQGKKNPGTGDSPKWILFQFLTSEVTCGDADNPPAQDAPPYP
ncbi:MAG: hypothetical protein BMS9Abin02_1203 [Anaerolineae bacterium]|nr:MAG: hypothetical protein BMS9Abin02_1203 [Anaerolineae bacterium]